MSDPDETPKVDAVAFDRAEFTAPQAAALKCVSCGKAPDGAYYEMNGAILCPACAQRIEASQPAGRVLRATLYGAGVAAAGAVIYTAIVRFTGFEFGLMAVVLGYLIGRAVRIGSDYRGGWKYQAIAMSLTYAAIASQYAVAIYNVFSKTDRVPNIFVLIYLCLTLPFMMGFKNILGLIIMGIGLFEAWKLNKRVRIAMTGPYTIAPAL